MECKVTESPVAVNEVIYEAVTEQPVETDFTLPDYCPDIGRILKCRAVPGINMRTVSGEQLNIEGVTRLEVIYIDGRDKHVRCCMYDLPFAAKIPLTGCPDGAAASVEAHTEYVNCRAISQRRLDIRGAFTLHVRVTAKKSCGVISDVEGAGVHVRRQSITVSECVGRTQSAFTVSESLELSDGKPPIASIIRSSASVTTSECKPIANKLIVKGEACVRVIYTAEPEGKVEAMEYVLPFNQFLDMAGVDDSCTTDCRIDVTALEIGLRTDPDGEYRRMSVDIRAMADVTAFRSCEISVMSDAYSVDCELDVERRMIDFERYCGSVSASAAAEAVLEAGRELVQVLDSWCEPVGISAAVRGGKVCVSGKVQACTIARCADGDCEFMEKTVPFECELPVSDTINSCRASCAITVKGCTFTLSGSAKVSIRAELAVTASVYDELRLSCISSVRPDETRIKNHDDEPALVVYFAQAGEELWDIARQLGASVETIQSDNDISDACLDEDRMLLISVR